MRKILFSFLSVHAVGYTVVIASHVVVPTCTVVSSYIVVHIKGTVSTTFLSSVFCTNHLATGPPFTLERSVNMFFFKFTRIFAT